MSSTPGRRGGPWGWLLAGCGALATVVLASIGNDVAPDRVRFYWPWAPALAGTGIGSGSAALLVARLALVALVAAWAGLGVLVHRRRLSGRMLVAISCVWSLPLLLSAPMFSQDLYAYAASGTLQAHGLDPYLVGPAALGGSGVVHAVSPAWTDTPSPYGPGFLVVTRAVAAITGPHYLVAVVWLRVLMVAALAAGTAFAVGLAKRHGRPAEPVLWLLPLNPLVLTSVAGAGHNDALVLALLAGAFWLHRRGHRLAAVIATTVAAEVKVVALAATLVLVVEASIGADALADRLRRSASAAAVAALSFAGLTTLAGLPLGRGISGGWGWVHTLGVPGHVATSLTPVSAAWKLVRPSAAGVPVAQPWRDSLLADMRLAALVVGAVVALVILRRQRRLGPERTAAAVLALAILFGPSSWPWYAMWPMALLAVVGGRIERLVLAALSAALVFAVAPSGHTLWGSGGRWPGRESANIATLLVAAALTVGLLHAQRGLLPKRGLATPPGSPHISRRR